jgi:hypothetical protein
MTIRRGAMSQEQSHRRQEPWVGTVIWALLVVTSIVLMTMGLMRALFFGYTPDPVFVEDARVGGLLILAGSVASVAAAVWSARRGDRPWITAFVAAPAVLVGGAALIAPNTLLRQLAAIAAFPLALAGLFAGLPWRKP